MATEASKKSALPVVSGKLADQHCESFDGGLQPLLKREAHVYHAQIPQWTLHQKSIEREFRFKSFDESMVFVDKVAELARKEDHHPDIHLTYNRVRLQITTHAIGGLGLNDFILAAKVDALM